MTCVEPLVTNPVTGCAIELPGVSSRNCAPSGSGRDKWALDAHLRCGRDGLGNQPIRRELAKPAREQAFREWS